MMKIVDKCGYTHKRNKLQVIYKELSIKNSIKENKLRSIIEFKKHFKMLGNIIKTVSYNVCEC